MANEIDLYQDLERAEGFLKHCQNKIKSWKETEKTAKATIQHIVNEIKERYPELVLGS